MFDALLTPLLILIVVSVGLAFLKSFLSKPKVKGAIGEVKLHDNLQRQLSDEYRVVTNILMPSEHEARQDDTTQIDHVVVSRYGVFVIETKNYEGWILGGERQKTWTQSLYKKKFKFQNPLHQNYKHMKAIQSRFKVSDDKIQSLVVFVGKSEFKTDMPDNVVDMSGVLGYIQSFDKKVISQDFADNVVYELKTYKFDTTRDDNKQHVQRLRKQHAEK